MATEVKHRLSMLKSIIWRVLGALVLAIVVYSFTREWITTGLITVIHHATFLLVFYGHERLWFKIKKPIGKLRNVIKALIYEVVLGMGLGGLIVLIITGQWSTVGKITISYTAIKLIMYFVYDRVWLKFEK